MVAAVAAAWALDPSASHRTSHTLRQLEQSRGRHDANWIDPHELCAEK
jgi:hypothetical protein